MTLTLIYEDLEKLNLFQYMNEFFKNKEDCFNYLKFLYEEFYKNYSDVEISESEVNLNNTIYTDFWADFINNPNVPKFRDSESFFFFSMNLVIKNFSSLKRDLLRVDNMDIPEKKSFRMVFSFRESKKRRGDYEVDIEGVFTEKQLKENLNELAEDWSAWYEFSPDFETIDSEFDRVELDDIREQ
jgi:hypothetical protein